ncbi:MAG TPA: gliding motility-associated C-terminal domain-containing protein [Bacteroidales bacterium]|nr:gliding motility-associated C-terminal domain-containing protein [Bacteroidales bacterium]
MKKTLLLFFFLLFTVTVFGTHQRAGEITYTAISDLEYNFTIITYTYTPSPADRPELLIRWGDGTSEMVMRTLKINLPNNISRNEYAGAVHTFPGQGTYLIKLEDPNRNYGVLNIPNSVNVPFFLQTELVINPFLGPNNSVQLLAPPVDVGCVNNLYLHNPVAYDVDGDSLVYKLVPCLGASGLPIPGYILPNEVGGSTQNTFEINAATGTIIWDKPVLQGEYNIAFVVEEWRYGVKIGYVTRDMQISIIACSNQPPQIAPLNDTCVVIGETLTITVTATDPDNNMLSLQAMGGPLILEESPAIFPRVTGQGEIASTFTWTPVCQHIQLQPYQVVFTAKDSLNFPQLVDIKTVAIKVISPAPENLNTTAVGNTIHLSWSKALCEQGTGYELYRRNGFYGFMPNHCETGIPGYTGYSKIESLTTVEDTTYIDNDNGNGLIHGIDYCYMVVATFADGSKSIASPEVCASLIKDVPIITNVSVENTDQNNGEIFVAWSKPTELDTLLFPPPYFYIINRSSTGQNPPEFIETGITGNINDTLFTDAGLNTADSTYVYRIDFYSNANPDKFFIGSTQQAFSMFLQIDVSDKSLNLSWEANTPWENEFYTIYRLNQQTLVFDSVGKALQPAYQDFNLENGTKYTYYVKSTGQYSAPGIINPIINFSQIASGIPQDNLAPCPPELTATTNCETVENKLTWINPDLCPEDIKMYYIHFSSVANEPMIILDSVMDAHTQVYLHNNLLSIAGCYGITAADSAGNVSEMSNVVCVDITACGTYRLPNVFTPNEDSFNDRYKAFPFTSVERIKLTIFNRWGKIVYETSDPWFEWDGKNQQNNQECSEGVYFYVCDVFEIQLEGLTKRTITGSVMILR